MQLGKGPTGRQCDQEVRRKNNLQVKSLIAIKIVLNNVSVNDSDGYSNAIMRADV